MSRFFASAVDSDSSSSDEEISEVVRRPLVTADSSDDEELSRRVVKTATTKCYEELEALSVLIKNYKKINDFPNLLKKSEDLIKIYEKYAGQQPNESARKLYISTLGELLNYTCAAWDDLESRKALNKNNFKSLSTLRQKIRKYCKNLETEVNEYLTNPEAYMVVEVEEAEVIEEVKEESEESIAWDSSGSESSSDDATPTGNLRERFLKKSSSDTKKPLKIRKPREAKIKAEDSEWKTVKGGEPQKTQSTGLVEDEKLTASKVSNKIKEIFSTNSLKRLNRRNRIDLLINLLISATSQNMEENVLMEIRFALMRALCDVKGSKLVAMDESTWCRMMDCAMEIAENLNENILLSPDDVNGEDSAPYKICGSVADITERLLEEHAKVLKSLDHFSDEYVIRLRDEMRITGFLDKALAYVEKCEGRPGQVSDLCRLKLSKIEQLHYKYNSEAVGDIKSSQVTELAELCGYVYRHDSTDRLRTRAILFQIYFLALHDYWIQARDFMLMSHLQTSISYADQGTQILYNRAMTQLGLCAFRHGLLPEAMNCLTELMNSGKTRELIGQGFSSLKNVEVSREKELTDKCHQVPFHMNISMDEIEFAYLVSAMLVDLPNMVKDPWTRRRISKTLYQTLRLGEIQKLQGPPESTKEFILAACKALRVGDWQLCRDSLFNKVMDTKVWTKMKQTGPTQENLLAVIQKQALQCYIFSAASTAYDKISLSFLADMYALSQKEVQGVISTMIIQEEINACINPVEQILVFKKESQKTGLQSAVHRLVERLTYGMDVLEKTSLPFRDRGRGGLNTQQRGLNA